MILVIVLRHGLFAPLAKTVDDAIARHAVEPGADLFNRFRQTIGREQLEENVLQNVFGLARIGHALADEAAQATAFACDSLGEALVLLSHQCVGA